MPATTTTTSIRVISIQDLNRGLLLRKCGKNKTRRNPPHANIRALALLFGKGWYPIFVHFFHKCMQGQPNKSIRYILKYTYLSIHFLCVYLLLKTKKKHNMKSGRPSSVGLGFVYFTSLHYKWMHQISTHRTIWNWILVVSRWMRDWTFRGEKKKNEWSVRERKVILTWRARSSDHSFRSCLSFFCLSYLYSVRVHGCCL